ncbi:MAG: FAD-dependent oxidoreductase, partial [Acidimicrobiales bacterium]
MSTGSEEHQDRPGGFAPEIETIIESNDEIESILNDPGTELPPLLPALARALNDPDLLVDELWLDPAKILDEQGGWSADQQQRCRELALAALIRLRDDGPAAHPDPAIIDRLVCWITGTDLSGSYLEMLTEELGPDDSDLRAPDWSKDTLAPEREFRVAIIGAGMSGILMAHRLQQAGVEVVMIEKNPDIGGTWFENTYPGCRVDVSNHVYAYSFMQKHDWPQFHSAQADLLEYFDQCADLF